MGVPCHRLILMVPALSFLHFHLVLLVSSINHADVTSPYYVICWHFGALARFSRSPSMSLNLTCSHLSPQYYVDSVELVRTSS